MPKVDYNPYWSVYFVIFICCGYFFLLNLFDGVVIDNYFREKEEFLGIGNFTQGQKKWIQLQYKVGTQKPKFEVLTPQIPWKAKLYNFLHNEVFEWFIIIVILFNMIIFMAYRYDQSESQETLFDIINWFILVLFILEAFLKLLCMGTGYFKDSWNVFDFSILMVTMTSTILKEFKILELGKESSILRVFRVGRVLRLINRAKSLRMIFNTFLITLPALAIIGLFLLIVIFIFTVSGMQAFAYLRHGNSINHKTNFQTFFMSFMTLFRVSTGEGWNYVMDDMRRQLQPNFVCYAISDYDAYEKHGQMGCGFGATAELFMITF